MRADSFTPSQVAATPSSSPAGGYTIRMRTRRQASPPRGMKSAWEEWQVVDGKRVVSRHDTERQAREWADKNPKA